MLLEWLNGMTPAELVGQILGVIVIIGCIINSQFPKRWQMLLCQVFLNVLSAINMFLLNQGLAASLPCFVAALHCIINVIRDKKSKAAPLWETILFCSLYPVAWGVGFVISIQNGSVSALHFIPLLALAFFIASVLVKREQLMRLFILGNSAVYLIYNIIFQNVAVFAYVFSIISILIALFRYRKSPKKEESET